MVNTKENEITKYMREYLMNFDQLPCGFAVVKNDSFSTLIQANPAFYRMIGYTKQEFLEKHENHMKDIVVDNLYHLIVKKEKTHDFDFQWDLRIRKSDGSVAWIHDASHYNVELDVFFLIYTDNTDKMITADGDLSYEAFQAKNEILTYLSKYTSKHFIVTDVLTDKVVYMSPSFMKLSGFHEEKDWHNKTHIEVGFGSIENVDISYYQPVNEETFTSREYYNKFYKKHVHVDSKIITIPTLKHKMRLSILNDITPQKKLEQRMAFRTTLYNCIESLFTIGATNTDVQNAYFDILNQLKIFYHADGAFFYKFAHRTHEIESVYKVLPNGVRSSNHNFHITATNQQIKLLQELSDANTPADKQMVLNTYSEVYQSTISQLNLSYQLDDFACVTITNAEGDDAIAFMGISNPQYNQDDKELMQLLSRFICIFIEHQQDDRYKEEALKLESISKTTVVETCVKNFQNLSQATKNINSSLDVLCKHYDADFSLALMKQADGSCTTAYVGGMTIPNLTPFQEQGASIMEKWTTMFGTQPKFSSSTDFASLNTPHGQKILREKYGIYNFIVAPIQDSNGILVGLLFVNNFKLLNRSRLIVHVVSKNISDYLSKINMYENTQLEPATRLTNKVATQNRIADFLEKEEKGALFVIDVDNFKQLNDTLGHHTGDRAIIDLANILKQIFRATDVIGRIGGDEFMVFAPGLISDDLIKYKADQILQKCNITYKENELCTEISTSIGICSVSDNCNTFNTLYAKADYALYCSKKGGKNQYHIYIPTDKPTEQSWKAN